ncbi:MAG: M56 family metallopeptidase, partial [Planctomycetota bacterium]
VTLGAWLTVKLHRLSREHPEKTGKASLPQSFYDQLADCARRLGLRREPTPVVTSSIQTPAVFGLLRPVLLMPVGYIRNLSRKDTEYLLLHELAHIKRGDLVVHGIYMLLQVVYWYNPLLWLVRRRLRHLRELCCDATVASLLKSRTLEYRRTLLEATRQFLVTPVEYGLGLVGLFEDSNCLISRINSLEKPIWRYRKMKNAAVITIILVLLACVLPMAQAQKDPDSPSTSSEAAIADSAENSSQTKQELEQSREELLKAMKALQFQLQQLRLEKQKLEHELHAESHGEHQVHQAHQAAEHAAHAELKAKEAKEKAAKASVKAKRAKDEASEVKRKAQTEHLQQWAKHTANWAEHYKTWADSDEFKHWQEDVQKWAQELAKFQTRAWSGTGDPAPEPGPMPVMPPMPSMPAPVVPMPPSSAIPNLTLPAVSIPEISVPGEMAGMDPILPTAAAADATGRDIEVKKDKDGKYVATTEMQFVSKVKPGAPFVIRNNMGRIVLRPSKDGKCDVRAVIRAKADTPAEAKAKAEQVSMNLDSSDERYFLKPVKRDGGKWQDLNVDLYISLPPGVLPDIQTNMGSIELYDLKGQIKIASKMGSIKAVNTTGDLELLTKMGSIEFLAPKDLSAKFSATTKMGGIESDLPLKTSKSGMFQQAAQGTIGAGRGNIRMSTDMGGIRLKWYSPAEDSPVL